MKSHRDLARAPSEPAVVIGPIPRRIRRSESLIEELRGEKHVPRGLVGISASFYRLSRSFRRRLIVWTFVLAAMIAFGSHLTFRGLPRGSSWLRVSSAIENAWTGANRAIPGTPPAPSADPPLAR